jgi:signal transduction histidine kinase
VSDESSDSAPSPADRRPPSLRRRIRSAFFLQVAAIGMATVLGVYGAYFVLEDVLVRRALIEEAAHYATRLAADPDASLPDTYNLRGFLYPPRVGDPPVPLSLEKIGIGYGNVPMEGRSDIVHVSDTPVGRLYLVFAQEQVNRLALFFGFVPLSIVLIAIYLIVWMTYRSSKRAVSPVVWLANHVRDWDPKRPDYDDLSPERLPPDAQGEVEMLASAMRTFAQRNQAFVARERDFTRDASHELRSPLTIIKIASDILLTEDNLSPFATRNIDRIRRSARDMEALIEAFPILARESDTGLPIEDFLANDVVLEEIENAQALVHGKSVDLRGEVSEKLELHAPPRVLAVVLSNLIRNACQHTDEGEVVVTIRSRTIRVADTGTGMSEHDLVNLFEPFYRGALSNGRGGHGIGMTIVKRLCDRFGWTIEVRSSPGAGTAVTIGFPTA